MKNMLRAFLLMVCAGVIFAACNKLEDLPFYKNGNAVTLSSSVSSVSPTPADSLLEVIAFSWTSPNYASDSSTFKYLLELDTSNAFTSKYTKEVSGALFIT